MELSICIIGCGGQAFQSHLPSLARCLREDGGLRFAGCSDLDEERARRFRAELGQGRSYGDWRRMLREERPDCVLLVTPFTVTAAIAEELLRLGVPTLLEKPLGENAAQARALLQAARDSGTIHQVAFNRRHMPLIRALLDRLRGRPIRHIDYRMHRVDRREDHFHTTAVHGLDLCLYLAGGACLEMHSLYQPLPDQGIGVQNVQALCRYGSGATASLSFCPCAGLVCEQLAVCVDGGSLFVDLPIWGARGNPGLLAEYRGGERVFQADGLALGDGPAMFESNGFYHQLRSFLQDVAAGRMPADTLETGLGAMELSDCLREGRALYRPDAAL